MTDSSSSHKLTQGRTGCLVSELGYGGWGLLDTPVPALSEGQSNPAESWCSSPSFACVLTSLGLVPKQMHIIELYTQDPTINSIPVHIIQNFAHTIRLGKITTQQVRYVIFTVSWVKAERNKRNVHAPQLLFASYLLLEHGNCTFLLFHGIRVNAETEGGTCLSQQCHICMEYVYLHILFPLCMASIWEVVNPSLARVKS